jgi:replicative DNA helicase
MTKTNTPHNQDAEAAILGAILLDNKTLPKIEEMGITVDDFYFSSNQSIFNAIIDLKEAEQVIDSVTLTSRLRDLRKLDSSGGIVYIAELLDTTLSSANVEHYCKIVKDKSLRRQVLQKSLNLATESQDTTTSITEIISRYQQGLGIEEPRTVEKYDIKKSVKELQKKIQRGFPGIDPCYEILRQTIRKFVPGTMIVAGAYTSVGKSALAVDLTARLYRKGNPAEAIFSLEMSSDQYLLRLLANETRFPTWSIRENKIYNPTQEVILQNAYEHFQSKNLYIYDNLYNFNDIRKQAASLKASNAGLDIVIVDYVQNVHCDGRTIYERMSNLTTHLFAMAKDLEITLIVLSQINNESAKDTDSPIIGYKGAGEIAAAADVGIWLEKDKENEDQLIFKVRKNRDGRTSEGVLKYVNDYTRFMEVEGN